jgi:hypothetical protein
MGKAFEIKICKVTVQPVVVFWRKTWAKRYEKTGYMGQENIKNDKTDQWHSKEYGD